MEDCLFCKIIAGEIPCTKVYEDEMVFCFLDIAPINKGHILVIPKKHSTDLYSLPEEDLFACAKACQKMAVAVKNSVAADGINLGMNNGKAAGQLVPHAHFHVMPRFENDGLKHWPGGSYNEGEAEELAAKIISNLP